MGTEDTEALWFDCEPQAVIDCAGEPVVFYRRRWLRPRFRRRLAERDFYEILIQGTYASAAALAPVSAWPGICRAGSRIRRVRHIRKRFPQFRDKVRGVLGEIDDFDLLEMFDQWRAGLHQRRLATLREWVRPSGVRYVFRGKEHLERSLADGGGAIIWASQFMAQSMEGKRGLAEAGFRCHQVSVRQHGPSGTGFGVRVINPITVRAENRHLAGRLVFEPEEAASVTRRALRMLQAGDAVIFTNNAFAGSSFAQLPFGQSAFLSMATTPVALATSRRKPLHVLTTIRRKPFQEYEIHISPNLATANDAAESGGGRDYVAMASTMVRSRDILLEAVRAAPDQHLGWMGVETRPIVPDKPIEGRQKGPEEPEGAGDSG